MSCIQGEEWIKCHAIIHAASAAAGAVGAGLAQLPCSDNLIITPVQLAMTISLGQVFGISLTECTARSAMVSAAGSMVGRTTAQLAVGWLPIAGNIINACTAVTVTEGLGWLVAEDFARERA